MLRLTLDEHSRGQLLPDVQAIERSVEQLARRAAIVLRDELAGSFRQAADALPESSTGIRQDAAAVQFGVQELPLRQVAGRTEASVEVRIESATAPSGRPTTLVARIVDYGSHAHGVAPSSFSRRASERAVTEAKNKLKEATEGLK